MAIKNIIPEIDISPFLNKDSSPAERSSIIRQVAYALKSIGFLTIVGHNVPHTVIISMLQAAKEFMYLPNEAKLSVASQKWNPSSKNKYRGYWPSSVFGKEGLDLTDYRYKGQLKDVFHLYEENIFPTEFSEAGIKSIQDYYDHLHDLALALFKLIFECFGADTAVIEQGIERPHCLATLRINYYPEHAEHEEAIEMSPEGLKLACETHKDGSLLTILYQDKLGGLQVQSPNDLTWHDVPFNPNAFVVNTGVGLQRLTNDHWKATNHRVLFNRVERVSLPFFTEGTWDFPIDSKYLFPNEEPKYKIQLYGEYITNSNRSFKEYQRD